MPFQRKKNRYPSRSNNVDHVKVYKFRSLKTASDLLRLKEVIITGSFWCSKFSDLNDPMEGIFLGEEEIINKIHNEKQKYKICSFSGEAGFDNPLLWGYYANGFRGVAIEIDVPEETLKKVDYVSHILEMGDVDAILTTKLENWSHEDEYRFLTQEKERLQKVGKIKAIYFGNPYKEVKNFRSILLSSCYLEDYYKKKKEILDLAKSKDIACLSVKVSNGLVVKDLKA